MIIHRLTDSTKSLWEIWARAVDGTWHMLDHSDPHHTFYEPMKDDEQFEAYREFAAWSVDENWQSE